MLGLTISKQTVELFSLNGLIGAQSFMYFFDGRSLSRYKMEVLHLAGALMEHFLEGIAPLRHLVH